MNPKVVIVGGGFGGLAAARALRRAPVQITLVDRSNHHLFQPLLYQVATAALSPAHIAVALRRVLRRQRNVTVMMAEVSAVEAPQKRLRLADGSFLSYDFLILATGATHSYFGHAEWAALAPGLKTLDDAITIRRRVLVAYEEAERETDPARRDSLLTFVVVGAGPTGVELAGALSEIARHVLKRDFRNIDPASSRVVLVEAGPRVLATFAPDLSAAALRRLERMGVRVVLDQAVTGIDEDGVTLAGGERLRSRTVLWAAGVQASPLGKTLGAPVDRAGRVVVAPDLSVAPGVFVIGDVASMPGVPGVAPAAIQGGQHVARQIQRLLRGEATEPFHYRDKGSLATIGRAAAVAQLGRLHLAGLVAWLLWLFVHVLTLVGFRNRVLVLLEWASVYLRYERGARLITFQEPPALTPSRKAGPDAPP